jgi:MFS transporter, PPP family, 3-phenylpropionic acid transporter
VVVSNLACGWLIGRVGILLLPVYIAILLLLPAAATLTLPRDATLGAGEENTERASWRDVLADRGLLGAMLAASLIMGSHGVVMNFGAIQWAAAGISPASIGVLSSIAVAAEIGFYWFGRALLGGRDPRLLLIAATLASVLRWAMMALNPGFWVLLVVQMLHGVTSTGAILAVMLLIADRVPAPLVASAQGINAVLIGVVLAGVMIFSGFIWNLGVAPAYAMMSVIALFALLPLALMRGRTVVQADA